MKFTAVASATLLVVISTSSLAQQTPKPEALIKWRQSVFQVLGWNNARIKSNVEGAAYNKDEVVKAANSTAAIAASGFGALFPAGTETGKGWHDTATKAEFFKEGDKVASLAGNFSKEASELASVAATGDQAAVKAQFVKLNQTCRACHDDYKSKD